MNKQELLKQAQEVIKTLPIAHYLRMATLPVEFSDKEDTSYFDPKAVKIVIAFSNIEMNAKNTNPKDEIETEKIVRCFLYHEVSHAIMTPRDSMELANSWAIACKNGNTSLLLNPQLCNIMEDERIETILNGYYYNVDFRWNFRNSCPLDKMASFASFEGFVFNAFRSRYCPIDGKAVNKIVNDFIDDNKDINSMDFGYTLCFKMNETLLKLKPYFDKLMAMLPKNNQQSQNGNPSNQQSQNSNGNGNSSSQSQNQEAKQDEQENADSESSEKEEQEADKKANDKAKKEIIENGDKEQNWNEAQLSKEEQENIAVAATIAIKKSLSQYDYSKKIKLSDFEADKKDKTEMLKVIGKNKGFGKAKAPVSFGYTGKFTAKKLLTDFNDTRKWFEKKSFEETGKDGKKGDTKTLNIWLDNSGSFEHNDYKANVILKALADIEASRDDFKFNLIRVEMGLTILKGDNRVSRSKDNTQFDKNDIDNAYKATNKTQREVNIILFDGRIFSNLQDYQPLSVFNNKRAIFITESDNYEPIKSVCPMARDIINECYNYTDRLSENIVRALNILF